MKNFNNKILKNKNIIITGCNKGIGKAILTKFVENGANCICCIRKPNKSFKDFCNKLKKKNNIKIDIVRTDLSNEKTLEESTKRIFKNYSKIDVLINNAGVLFNSLFLMTSQKQLKELFQINYFSHIYLTQQIARKMIKFKSGNIVFISSTSAEGRDFGRFAYSGSKAAISSAARILANELSSYGIRVNSISPGLIETDLMRNNTNQKNIESELSKTSLKRIGKPDEVAELALFLASDLSSFITGQNIRIDGGLQ